MNVIFEEGKKITPRKGFTGFKDGDGEGPSDSIFGISPATYESWKAVSYNSPPAFTNVASMRKACLNAVGIRHLELVKDA